MSLYTEKTEISKSDYFMLIGLLAVGKEHMKAIDVIQRLIENLLGEKHDSGHSGDALFGDYTADQLLEKSEIKVVENAD